MMFQRIPTYTHTHKTRSKTSPEPNTIISKELRTHSTSHKSKIVVDPDFFELSQILLVTSSGKDQ